MPPDDLRAAATDHDRTDTIAALDEEHPDDPTTIPTETAYESLKSQSGIY